MILGMGLVICKPGDPEAKGMVERASKSLETSFLPGRRFSSPQDFNARLAMRSSPALHGTLPT